jgi:hypothetical protein
MNLCEANKTLEELLEPFIEAQEAYSKKMVEIDIERSHLYQSEAFIALRNAEAREAYITGVFETDGTLEEKQIISNNYYRLKHKKDLLIEICKNLRILEAR